MIKEKSILHMIFFPKRDKAFFDLPIKDIITDTRAVNAFLRSGVTTAGEFINRFSCEEDMLKIRGCGSGTTHETFKQLFLSYCDYLDQRGLYDNYILKLYEANKANPLLNKIQIVEEIEQ